MAKIRLFYEPPPYGIGTDLNRTGYGIGGGGLLKPLLEKASRMPQSIAIGVPCLVITALCWIPLMNLELPFSMDPEYQAASRAYMRYHNMNPIFGISSKRARAMDPDP